MSYRVSSVRTTRLVNVAVIVVGLLALASITPAGAAPSGQMTWAVHISLAPTWFDPAETPSLITPFMVLYAMHDALVKPMPGAPQTAEDVKFSFERYKGAGAKLLKDRVAAIEIVDRQKVRFRLHKPWLDFMTFFATPATGAAWIVPKKYVEKVGEDGFKRAPIGAGPYKFVSFKPGVELVLEAYEGY